MLFAKLYLGNRFMLPWSRMHREIAGDLADALDSPKRLAVAAPDGYGKTTLISFAYVLWALAYRRKRCIVIGSGTRTGAGEILAGIDNELRRNQLLTDHFPHLVKIARGSGASGSRASPPRLLYVPGVARVSTMGPGSRLSEISFEGVPPDLFVLDGFDTINESPGRHSAADIAAVDRLESILERRIIDRHPYASVVVTDALLDEGSLIDRLLAPDRTRFWTQRFYPAVERYPDGFELWFEWAALTQRDPDAATAFVNRHRVAMLSSARVLWPEHESFEDLMHLRAERGWAWFDRFRQGAPPGGCLRTSDATSTAIDVGGSREAAMMFVDDAGYVRTAPGKRGLLRNPILNLVFDEGEVGKPLPPSADRSSERAF